MSIKRLTASNPYEQTLGDIDNNIFELNGLISQAKFDKNEIDSMYGDLGLSRKFKIQSGAGNSAETYSNWSHVNAESGYSIWSIPFTNFRDNTYNEMYLDDVVMSNMGEANQESYSAFSKIFLYDGVDYTDLTTALSAVGGTAQSLMADTSSFIYCGLGSTFSAIDCNFNIRGANYTLKLEYWNGSAWTQLTTTASALDDNTSNFKSDGRIEYTTPSDWATTAVNSVSAYYVRISTTTTPVTTATAYSIFPGASVYSLLQLSSSEAQNKDWKWCYYNDKIYATIPSVGNSSYEGNKFITSSSSATNLQNYFVYNHAYKLSYEQTSYTTGASYTPTYGYKLYTTGSGFNIINYSNSTPFTITNTDSTALAVRLNAGENDTTTGAGAGTGGDVPVQIAKYLAISVDGTTYKIPLYAD